MPFGRIVLTLKMRMRQYLQKANIAFPELFHESLTKAEMQSSLMPSSSCLPRVSHGNKHRYLSWLNSCHLNSGGHMNEQHMCTYTVTHWNKMPFKIQSKKKKLLFLKLFSFSIKECELHPNKIVKEGQCQNLLKKVAISLAKLEKEFSMGAEELK